MAIAAFFRDWAPGTLTGGAETKVYEPPVSVLGAQSRKNAAIAPKLFNSLNTNFNLESSQRQYISWINLIKLF